MRILILAMFGATIALGTPHLARAQYRGGTGLDFPALLQESLESKASPQNGLLLITRENRCDPLPQNHAEMVECVEQSSVWNPDRSGFSVVSKVYHRNNPHGADDNYTMLYTGFFYAEVAGVWKFSTRSDDASEIVVDGQLIVGWYGEHSAAGYNRDHQGSIQLEQGWHHITYRFVEGTGDQQSLASFYRPDERRWREVSTRYLQLKTYPVEPGLLLITRKNTYDHHPQDHDELLNCVETAALPEVIYSGWRLVESIAHDQNVLGRDDHYTSLYQAWFRVTEDNAGDWQFATDSGSASEVEIDGQVVASWYGGHDPAGETSHSGTVTLTPGWHQLVYRQEVLTETPAARAFFTSPTTTQWTAVSTQNLELYTYAADIDGDGLHNDLEAILGTTVDYPDTDFEGLNDFCEAMIDSNPLKPDSNDDGLADSIEIHGGNHDPDDDGLSNLNDRDNDNDGVEDGLDISPFATSPLSSEFKFEITTNGDTTYLDFQLRPEDQRNLLLLGKQWDWPHDTVGQMQDRDNSREDVQLIPMLELTANVQPDQEHVEENGIYVTEENRLRALDARFTHDDGIGVGNVLGDHEKEVVVAWDKDHKITVRDITGTALKQFDCVYTKGDKLVVADVLGDSADEILVFHDADNDVYVYSGEGHLITTAGVGYHSDEGFAVGNVKGDSKQELLFGYTISGHVHVRSFYKDGRQWRISTRAIDENDLYTANDHLATADVDGDGLDEILIAHDSDDRLSIWEYVEDSENWEGWSDQYVTTIDFDYDPHDGVVGADVLTSQDPQHANYGEEVLCLKPNGNVLVYTEHSSSVEEEIDDIGYTEFDGYTSRDIMGNQLREVIVSSDTSGAVQVYNPAYRKAYVPLSPVLNNGNPVAFQGRMVYDATGGALTITADARLVWFVIGKTDDEDDPSANETTVLAKYTEDFFLTGFSATEYRGINAALFYNSDRDAVGNAYLSLHHDFLAGQETLRGAADNIEQSADISVEEIFPAQGEEPTHDWESQKWIDQELRDTALPALPNGEYPVVFAQATRYAETGLADFLEGGVRTGTLFQVDLKSPEDSLLKSIKMNWYDTALDTVSPLTLEEIEAVLNELGHSEQEREFEMANYAVACAGEESGGEVSAALARNALGWAIKSGAIGAGLFRVGYAGNTLIQTTMSYFKSIRPFAGTGYKFKFKWMDNFKQVKAGGFMARHGKLAKAWGKFTKIGGPILGVAFAAYTFYRVADATGWSTGGLKIAGAYAGLGVGYLLAVTIIGSFGPPGAIIAGLIVLSDAIAWIITGKGWSDRLISWVVRKMTEINNPPKVDIDITSTKVTVVDYDDDGFTVGDRIEFRCRATEVVKKDGDTKASDVRDSYVKPYAKFYESDSYHRSSYRYVISNSLSSSRRTRVWDFGAWVEPKYADTDFRAKVELTAKLKVYYRQGERRKKTSNFSYGDTELEFDVMPKTLADFLNWRILTPLEKDDDGLANSVEDSDGPWFRLYNKERLDNNDGDWSLTAEEFPPIEVNQTTGDRARWRFHLADDGAFLLQHRRGGQFLMAESNNNSLYFENSVNDDHGHWDLVPVVDNYYFLVNRGRSDSEGERYCLSSDANGAEYARILNCRDFVEGALWQFSVEKAPCEDHLRDSDGDGLSDLFEVNYLGQGSLLSSTSVDTDNDGVTDAEELLARTDPNSSDTDQDGLSDSEELAGWLVHIRYDTLALSKKVYSDPTKSDSDDDGLSDLEERQASAPLNPRSFDTDGDGLADAVDPDPLNSPPGQTDSDRDGLSDGTETAGWELTVTTASGTQTYAATADPQLENSDSDGLTDADEYTVSDASKADTDEDGVLDHLELQRGTDPVHFDTDGDLLADGAEIDTHGTDPLLADSDGDGLSDGDELLTHGTDPLLVDSDSDGLIDSEEILVHLTDPTLGDTDSDGLKDGAEVDAWLTQPLVPDSDGDGLDDGREVLDLHTDPNMQDTDGDTLLDGQEVQQPTGHCSMPTRYDTDRDGLNDYDERYVYGTSACSRDTDLDGLQDGEELALGTDPNVKDSDGDMLSDGEEVHQHETDPTKVDTDGDMLPDNVEIASGTNPTEADTDADGFLDNLDLDSNMLGINPVLVLFDEVTGLAPGGPEAGRQGLVAEFEGVVDNVVSGTPAHVDHTTFPFIVLLGRPEGFVPGTGSARELITQLVSSDTLSHMLADDHHRFSTSAVHRYTGLPKLPTDEPPSPTGIQVDLGLENSLVVVLAEPYRYDATRVLNRFSRMLRLYWYNFDTEVAISSSYPLNPVTSLQLDSLVNTDATIENLQLSQNAAYAQAAVVSYVDSSTPIQLTTDNGLFIGAQQIDKYLLVECVASTMNMALPPQPEPIVDPVADAVVRQYYRASDLDRSFPRDGDIQDIGDIDEASLHLYRWDLNTESWQQHTSNVQLYTENVTINNVTYEGYIEWQGSELGLFALAGEAHPDTTLAGAPTVAAVLPAESAVDIALDTAIQITFSEEISVGEEAAFTISGAAVSAVTLHSNATTVSIGHNGLSHGVTYEVTIEASAVRDLAGLANEESYTWAFTTLPANNIPFAMDDSFSTDAETALTGQDLLRDNGEGEDWDSEDAALAIIAVNEQTHLVGSPVTGSAGGLFTIASDGHMHFDPSASFGDLASGEVRHTTATYQLSDGQDSDSATVTVAVVGLNDPPVLSADLRRLAAIEEDCGDDDGDHLDLDDDAEANFNNPGNFVEDILASSGTAGDPDGDALGMALVAVAHQNGSWQWSGDGQSWQQVSAQLSSSNALLLGPGHQLRFVPELNYNGTETGAVTFLAWDQSLGAAGEMGHDTALGAAWSTANAQVTVEVEAVNDPPSLGSATLNLDQHLGIFVVTTSGWQDIDGDPPGYLYQWLIDGQPLEAMDGPELPLSLVAPGDIVACLVSPFDGQQGTPVSTNTITAPNNRGDVNGDGVVDQQDRSILLQALSNNNLGSIRDRCLNAGVDVNGDGRIGLAEVLYILQYGE